ncbi:MAG: hypothetical protein M1832_003761 [Thelocarpon impressellum]|nr:MAG: hypothetical protein M1832_003761 [Thelocarpon impressellum]
MAFRQPTQHAPQRQAPAVERPVEPVQIPELQRQLEESREWVLFSPAAPSTVQTETTSTGRTRTAGLSRLSDFGSLETGAGRSEAEAQAAEDGDEEEELDSLDSHLHAFREPSIYRRSSRDHSGVPVLPTHDGLGTFPASSTPVQEHIFHFERYNPQRRKRSSLDVADDDGEELSENERTRRIQEWRMEQSRVLLDEVERETRRRRLSRAGGSVRTTASGLQRSDAVMSDVSRNAFGMMDVVGREDEFRDEEAGRPQESESFWKRITRRVIQDLIGIDESILSVILGESLVDEPGATPLTPRSAPEETRLEEDARSGWLDPSWEDRLLERLARELGILVHQLAEHPGAFSTYIQAQQTPDYVGRTTPVLPATFDGAETFSSFSTAADGENLTDGPHFLPTLPHHAAGATSHAALWGLDETPLPSTSAARSEADLLKLEREYWERELDASMVFSFLRNRFRRGASHAAHPTLVTSSPQSTAARAAMIRQQHPLVSRAHTRAEHRRSGQALFRRASVVGVKRPSSSCASQSDRGRRTRGSGSSSRNYWDIGTSVGSGSVGGLGAWGEV